MDLSICVLPASFVAKESQSNSLERDYLVEETVIAFIGLNDPMDQGWTQEHKEKRESTSRDPRQPLSSFGKPTNKMADHLRPMFI